MASVPQEKGKTMTEMKGKVYLTKDDMPKHCSECPFCNGSDECSIQDEDANFLSDTWDDLRCGCPLEEIDTKPKVVEIDQFKGWIPVTERLPEESGWYLVHKEGYNSVFHYSSHHKAFNAFNDIPNDSEISCDYWMPLPEPPKEVE